MGFRLKRLHFLNPKPSILVIKFITTDAEKSAFCRSFIIIRSVNTRRVYGEYEDTDYNRIAQFAHNGQLNLRGVIYPLCLLPVSLNLRLIANLISVYSVENIVSREWGGCKGRILRKFRDFLEITNEYQETLTGRVAANQYIGLGRSPLQLHIAF
jgi:hypothetical protein